MPQRPKDFRPPHLAVARRVDDRQRNQQPHRRLYNLQVWKRFRAWFLAEHPLCRRCEAKGRLAASVHVHHVRKLADHPEDLCDERYCEPLCESCHNTATARGE